MLLRKLNTFYNRCLVKSIQTAPKPVTETYSKTRLTKDKRKEEKLKEVLQHPDYFKVHNLFTVEDLFKASVHYGHKIGSLNKKMSPFIFGSRLNHLIFDLDITAILLRQALNFAAHIAYRDGIILFVSRNPRMTLHVENTAMECKEFAVTREWILGTFTNCSIVFNSYTRLPDLCIFLNTLEDNGSEHKAIREAAKMCIPTIGIVDSNCDPNLITYPVPACDDSPSSFKFFCKVFKEAILRGKNEKKKDFSSDKEDKSKDGNKE